MTRLTNDMRNELEQRLLKHAFEERINLHHAVTKQLANDIWDAAFPADMRARMEALPEGWLPKRDDVNFTIGEGSRNTYLLELSGLISDLCKVVGVRFYCEDTHIHRRRPYNKTSGTLVSFDHSTPMAERVEAWAAANKSLLLNIDEVRKQTRAALNSVTTLGALVKGWPEVEPFVQGWIKTPPQMLPALPVHRLNAMLDLPVENIPAETVEA